MTARSLSVHSNVVVPNVILHQIAQALVYARYGDWRYDPGNPSHDIWLERAERFAEAARIDVQRRHGDDGRGSIPSRPDDRPSTQWVQMIGGWVIESPSASEQERSS